MEQTFESMFRTVSIILSNSICLIIIIKDADADAGIQLSHALKASPQGLSILRGILTFPASRSPLAPLAQQLENQKKFVEAGNHGLQNSSVVLIKAKEVLYQLRLICPRLAILSRTNVVATGSEVHPRLFFLLFKKNERNYLNFIVNFSHFFLFL